MSYYYRSKFSVSNHAILRARQRIKGLRELDEVMVRGKIIEMLEKIRNFEFEDSTHMYYRIYGQKDHYLYFVVQKSNFLVTTVTPISFEKKYKLLNKDYEY